MRICDWCTRQIPWWRIRYCRVCGPKFADPICVSPPSRPTYAAEWLRDARRRGTSRGLPQ